VRQNFVREVDLYANFDLTPSCGTGTTQNKNADLRVQPPKEKCTLLLENAIMKENFFLSKLKSVPTPSYEGSVIISHYL